MGKSAVVGQPINMANASKRDMRTQFAAMCWRRRKEEIEILLVTTRTTGRWVVPKGWPIDGKSPAQSAAIEAVEEAGAVGIASERCIGVFTYIKDMPDGDLPVAVAVFPVEVTKLLDDWPERKLRRRRWMTLKKASKAVSDPELSHLILDPTMPKLLP
jgi:8-oxo-dGTP pyrophosphatase MutT (NUDIX family)